MKLSLLILGMLFSFFTSLAQMDALRYREQRFTSISQQTNVSYGSAPQWIFPYFNTDLKLNVYQPIGDTLSKRPLIIFAHSGGFINGSKEVDDMVALCDSFAKKGYVTATIDYRKGFNPLDAASAERAVYRGVQDGKAAVRYFKEKAVEYKIDTNYIYFGGMSAGGYIALHVAYMDRESDRPTSTYGGGTVNNLGCLDCAGNTFHHTSKVRAILDYWGALQDTTMIRENAIPTLVMHGLNDGVVPYNFGHPFNLGTLPKTMGGGPIFQRLQNLGIYSEHYTSTSSLHMLDGSDNGTFPSSGPNAFWRDTLLPKTTEFLVKNMKPIVVTNPNQQLFACVGERVPFTIIKEEANNKVNWFYPHTQILTVNNAQSDTLKIAYSSAGTYTIMALAFNSVNCASDTLYYQLTIEEAPLIEVSHSYSNINEYTFQTNPLTEVQWFVNNIDYGRSEQLIYPTANEEEIEVSWLSSSTNQACQRTNSIRLTHNPLKSLSLSENGWSVTPNPFSEKIMIRSEVPASVTVYDIHGKKLEQLNIEKEIHLQTTNWKAGIYLIQLKTDSQQEIIRMVK